jgi:hypothetical protein
LSPAPKFTDLMIPERGAKSAFCIFMASTICRQHQSHSSESHAPQLLTTPRPYGVVIGLPRARTHTQPMAGWTYRNGLPSDHRITRVD